jgi:SAM-dependent methyltransferase
MNAREEQGQFNAANRKFWDELCGTQMAVELGITGRSAEDLAAFDAHYLLYYPYLLPFLDRVSYQNQRVLEIGLGYGTVGQKLAERGARYQGLDIAASPPRMMRHRLRLGGFPGRTLQGSALELPFADQSLDVVVAIGCLHHTGNLPQAIQEIYRILKPGGHTLLMVYNRFSYDQWIHWTRRTLEAFLDDWGWGTAVKSESSEGQRGQYDRNQEGEAAPVTDFFSVTQIRKIFQDFSTLHWQRENCHAFHYLIRRNHVRRLLLPFMGLFGLDLYIHATK